MVFKTKAISQFFIVMILVFGLIQDTSAGVNGTVGTDIIHVPSDVSDLQSAINQIPNNGVIELASGTYRAPYGGYNISDLGKGFTVRATEGAQVILDGGGKFDILRFINSSLSSGKPVVFENIIFANGYSAKQGVAGGVTIYRANATFKYCKFFNNRGNSSSSAGGIVVTYGSTVFFIDTMWESNHASHYGGGLALEENSTAFIHRSKFKDNRTNLPGHSSTAAGGGIHVGNSKLRVSNSYFEDNQAGYVGGAIYAIGSWSDPVTSPNADVIISNSFFTDNQSQHDAGVPISNPTEGGAIHAEDQTLFKIFTSQFIKNRAEVGGAVTNYRATVEIYSSIFQGNQVTSNDIAQGFGGAISAVSNDTANFTTNYGQINRPSAQLTIQDTYIQGNYDGVTTVGQTGGGIYTAGDMNRTYGLNGVSAMGTLDENRAKVNLKRVMLHDLDVTETPGVPGTGVGGGILVDLVDLSIRDSLVINCDAIGTTNSSGGGIAVINQSFVDISSTTFANNSADIFGGGMFVQGSTINANDNKFIRNTINNTNFGSAIFTSPMVGRNILVNGVVQGSVISDNHGLPIYDDDRVDGPINDVRYNNNTFYHSDISASVYSDSLPYYSWKNVSQLNDLVITRSNGTVTDKSQIDNYALADRPATGAIIGTPPQIMKSSIVGSTSIQIPSYLGYIWNGDTAMLDEKPITSDYTGVILTDDDGVHTLSVDGQNYYFGIADTQLPEAVLYNSGDNDSTILNWAITSGTFLDVAIDQGVKIASSPTGSIEIPSDAGSSYTLYVITIEGGIISTVDTATPELYIPQEFFVLAGLNIEVNVGAISVSNYGGNTMSWTAHTLTPELIELVTTSGETQITTPLNFIVKADKFSPGTYNGTIVIDAGEAGTEQVNLSIKIVDELHKINLPVVLR